MATLHLTRPNGQQSFRLVEIDNTSLKLVGSGTTFSKSFFLEANEITHDIGENGISVEEALREVEKSDPTLPKEEFNLLGERTQNMINEKISWWRNEKKYLSNMIECASAK